MSRTELTADFIDDMALIGAYGDYMAAKIHEINCENGWWNDLNTGEDLHGKRNVGELLMLVVSEIAEAMEGHRKNLMDKHLPDRTQFSAELADAAIRIFDIAGSEGIDLGLAIAQKIAYNRTRADHKPENRRLMKGKKY